MRNCYLAVCSNSKNAKPSLRKPSRKRSRKHNKKTSKSVEKLPRSTVLRYDWRSADSDSILDPEINQNSSKIMKKLVPNTHLKIDYIFH